MLEYRTPIFRRFCSIHPETQIINNRCSVCMRARTNNYGSYVRRRNSNMGRNYRPVLPPVNRINRPENNPERENRLRNINSMEEPRNLIVEGRNFQNLDYYDLLDLEDVKVGLSLKNLNENSKILHNKTNHKCTICLESMENKIVRRLKCNHEFHVSCCDKWFEDKNSCPNCRKIFN